MPSSNEFSLDVVLNDVTGKSGQAIIKAIISGERDPQKLAALADWRVKKSKEEIAKALSYNGRTDYMYELADSFDIYQSYVKKMEECDKKMEELMRAQIAKLKKPQTLPPPLLALGAAHVKKKKRPGKNAPNIPIHELSWQWNQEVDLLTTAYFVFMPFGYAVQVLEV